MDIEKLRKSLLKNSDPDGPLVPGRSAGAAATGTGSTIPAGGLAMSAGGCGIDTAPVIRGPSLLRRNHIGPAGNM